MQTTQKIVIVILVLAALGLGYFLFKAKMNSNPSNNTSNGQSKLTTPSNPSYQNPSLSKISLVDLRNIISDGLASASDANIKQYSASVSNVAVDSSVLDVSGCNVTPNVMHLKMNQSFTLQNKDAVTHQIDYAQISAVAAAQSQKQTILNFQSPGNYPFRCDQSTQFMGVFLVTP